MNLRTRYLGLDLAHPFMPGASPLVDDLDMVLRLEDAGASAIVMHSLFEEQILRERFGFAYGRDDLGVHADTASCFPRSNEFALGPGPYLEQLRRIKKRVSVPVIGSLNGTTTEGWLEYSRLIQQAGADALEVNVYHVATSPLDDANAVERRLFDIVAVVSESVTIPVAVKLSPFYSSIPNVAAKLSALGAAGLVLFNRFYEADIDPEKREAVPRLELSTSSELLLRLRWLAVLTGEVRASLAVSGGVHEPIDAVKAVMAGASAVQLVSALLQKGPGHLAYVRQMFARWGDEHGYASIDDMRGSMSLKTTPDSTAFERGAYLRTLQSARIRRVSADRGVENP